MKMEKIHGLVASNNINMDLYNGKDIVYVKLVDEIVEIRGLCIRFENKLKFLSTTEVILDLLIGYNNELHFIQYDKFNASNLDKEVYEDLAEIKGGNPEYVKKLGDRIKECKPELMAKIFRNSLNQELSNINEEKLKVVKI